MWPAVLKGLRSLASAAIGPTGRKVIVLFVVIGGSLLGMFCAGERRQQQLDAAAAYEAARDTIVKAIDVDATQLKHDAVHVATTKAAATTARAKLRAAETSFAAHVDVLNDSTVSIDHATPTTEIPVAAALPVIQECKSAASSDSAAYNAVLVAWQDEKELAAAETRRADLAEQALAASHGSRFGFKTGAITGAVVVGLLVWVL